uniref:Zn(2)-C6 fungal-type domain-containing protein n=1 Tax=Ganoderma boninense TaxID=34458 RepID=A0A5K1JV31_9APHY|nr:Zn(2)-C6 fungal-type domain-containing protein [Ganoderma boninense]
MVSFDLHAARFKENQFVASGISHTGTRWKLVGVAEQGADGRATYIFTVTYAARFGPRRFCGALTDNGRVFSGTWSRMSHNDDGIFYLKKLSCDAMRFWPSLDDLDLNKPRSLWRFAIRAVLDQVRRRLFAKSRLRERLATRRHYVQLIRANLDGLPLSLTESGEELERAKQCLFAMTPSEAQFYRMVYEYRQRLAPKHLYARPTLLPCYRLLTEMSPQRRQLCPLSGGDTGARVICLDCHPSRDALDLCDKADCLGAVIGPDRRPAFIPPIYPLTACSKCARSSTGTGSSEARIAPPTMPFCARKRRCRTGPPLRAAAPIRERRASPAASSCASGVRLVSRGRAGTASNAKVRAYASQRCTPIATSSLTALYVPDDTFLCTVCEASEDAIKGKHKHKPMHALVLCQPARAAHQVEANQSMSVWLGALEAKFDEMQKASKLRLEALEDKIDRLAGHVGGSAADRSEGQGIEERLDALDGKMAKIEDMLGLLLSKLG